MISGRLTVNDKFLRKDIHLKNEIVESNKPDSPGSDNDAEDGDPYDDNVQNMFNDDPDTTLVGLDATAGGCYHKHNHIYYQKKYLKYKKKYFDKKNEIKSNLK